MAYLEHFNQEQRDMLASLPYRVGLMVSESDKGGGAAASAAEMYALEAIVTGFVEDFCKSEFVEEIMHETLKQRERWPSWHMNIETVPEQCRQAIELLATRMDYREVTSFKNNLIEIALGVAMAYREDNIEDAALAAKMKFYARYYIGRLRAKLKKERPISLRDAMNISQDEQKALDELTKGLQPFRIEGVDLRNQPDAA